MNILVTICARGGSKGIPGKNIKLLNGKPLIFYTIKVAKEFQEKIGNTQIVLSTDSDEILYKAEECGLSSIYKRPAELAGDTVGKIAAISDVLNWQEKKSNVRYDYVLDLDVTSPLRNLQDLTAAFQLISNNSNALNLFSVSIANRNPYFNMVEQNEKGYFDLVKKREGQVLTRQNAPKVYDMNASFYFYRRHFFDAGYRSAVIDKSIIYLIPHTCFDLDHPLDFEILSYLMENNKLDFIL